MSHITYRKSADPELIKALADRAAIIVLFTSIVILSGLALYGASVGLERAERAYQFARV